MPKEKKLLVLTIILGAMLPVSIFGLSFISEAFLILGVFCGISALLCLSVYLDLKTGKTPNLILIGLVMAVFGFAFLGASDFYRIVSIPLSALYAVTGLIILMKGIKDWHDGRRHRAPKIKTPMNKKIYIGIGLIVGGLFATIILFNILPILMGIGHVMVVVGYIFLGRGIAEKKNASSSIQAVNNSYNNVPVKPQKKIEFCARCGKGVDAMQTLKIDGVKYCRECKAAIDRDIKAQHTVCSVCGVDLPAENMHVIDDALLCHSCFLKKYGDITFYDEEEPELTVDDAVSTLRKKIIADITKNPTVNYSFASLLWKDAADCFPEGPYKWDGAWFNLDLKTHKLSAEVSTYPNQFGACREATFSLTADEFNRIAKRFNMSKELQMLKSDADWEKLFDGNLKAVIFSACEEVRKKEEEIKREEAKRYAVRIPAKYHSLSPKMSLNDVTIEISQRYSSRSIKIFNCEENYQMLYVRTSNMSSDVGRYPRILSAAEAVWLEKQVDKTVNDPDNSTWQSLPGGDTMNIVINGNGVKNISLINVKPIEKYSDLQHELQNLAQYGSLSEE